MFEASALAAMRAHSFPGNVRELEHWIEGAIALAPDGHIRAACFPLRGVDGARELHEAASREARVPEGAPEGSIALPLGLPLEEATKRYVDATVTACDGNKTEAARRLKVGRNTLARALLPTDAQSLSSSSPSSLPGAARSALPRTPRK